MTDPGYCDYPPAQPARRYRPAPPSPTWQAYCELAPRLADAAQRREIPAAEAYQRDLAALGGHATVTFCSRCPDPRMPDRWLWLNQEGLWLLAALAAFIAVVAWLESR